MSWSSLLHKQVEEKHDIYLMDIRNHEEVEVEVWNMAGPLPMNYHAMADDVILFTRIKY